MRRVYADYAATTPVRPEVVDAMREVLEGDWGNPSSMYQWGRAARRRVDTAREQVAALIGAQPSEIFFTSGGTEGDNWALWMTAYENRSRGNHVITVATEHDAVLRACQRLEKEGFRVTYLPVEPGTGLLPVEDLVAALTPETVLVSVMYVNNEIGTVQDIATLAEAVKDYNPAIVFHTDAVQAAGLLPLDVGKLKVDLVTLSAHKIYGPKGIGALWVRQGFPFGALFQGGGQERGLRPGTENVPGIVGFGKAAELARAERQQRVEHVQRLRDRFLMGVRERIPDVRLNGPDPFTHPEQRHPANANLSFPGVDNQTLLLRLDMKGIAVSAGPACSSGSVEPSHVLTAIGVPRDVAAGSIRVTFGMGNDEEDVDYLVTELAAAVDALRKRSGHMPVQV